MTDQATEATPSHRIELHTLTSCMRMRHPRNPKDHNIASIRQSFRRFGFVALPTIDVDGVMAAGHGRCEALHSMKEEGEAPPTGVGMDADGDWVVPVVVGVKFRSELEREAYIVADNQQVLAGGWDFTLLSTILGELHEEGGDDAMVGIGFEQIELDSLLGRYEAGDPDSGTDPEGDGGGGGNRPRTTITARVECPSCGHVFER